MIVTIITKDGFLDLMPWASRVFRGCPFFFPATEMRLAMVFDMADACQH
jgi:hypothetical protein